MILFSTVVDEDFALELAVSCVQRGYNFSVLQADDEED